MSQPPASLISSALVFLRSPRLRRAAAASLQHKARSLGPALAPKASFAAAVLLIVGALAGAVVAASMALAFSAPKIGRLIELSTDASAPRVFYALPQRGLTPLAQQAIRQMASERELVARSLARKLEVNSERGAALAGLSPAERESLLIRAKGARARLEMARTAAPPSPDPEALLARAVEQDALRLARLLREGASPERAARELRERPTPVEAPEPFAAPDMSSTERGFMDLERALEAAPAVSAESLTLAERLSPSWAAFPYTGDPMAYAEEQSNSERSGGLLLLGLAPLPIFALAIFLSRRLARRARSLALKASEQIEREREIQALGKAALKAPKGASSKPPRL